VLHYLKKNWFLLALVAVSVITIADSNKIFVSSGVWLKENNGPDCVIVLIFFLSGIALNTKQIKEGLADVKGTLLTLVVIFCIAPVIAILFTVLPLSTGIILGLFLVAAMPTTLSSGVVMTESAGGNSAHSLLITIIANSLAVVTIPVVLGILLSFTGDSRIIQIDQLPIMLKIATLVLLPLVAGMIIRNTFSAFLSPFLTYTTLCNQIGVIMMVWMALCAGRGAIVAEFSSIVTIIAVVFFFHLVLVVLALFITRIGGVGKGRRESIIFMGGQKTLPLSIILQVTLFTEFGIALVVCVVHHIIHLIMDAFLIQYLKNME